MYILYISITIKEHIMYLISMILLFFALNYYCISLRCIKQRLLPCKGRSVDISADGRRVAVGFDEGSFAVYSTAGKMREVATYRHCKEAINDIKYSPNQRLTRS